MARVFHYRHERREPLAITIPMTQLGAELRKRRKEEGLSLRDVEERTGMSASTLSRMERGHIPDLSIVEKLANWLGVNVQAAGKARMEIESDEDLMRAIEVHLRANKDLSEEVARSIARSYEIVMRFELEREKNRGKQ